MTGRIDEKPCRLIFFKLSLICLFMLLFFLPACGSVAPEVTIREFYRLWQEQDYEGMYELLDSDSTLIYPKEIFIERYANISRGIGLYRVELDEIREPVSAGANQANILSTINLDTSTIGRVEQTSRLELSRDKKSGPWLIRWHPGLILTCLDNDSRVEVRGQEPRRGAIYDRHGAVLAGPRTFKEAGAVPGVYGDEQVFARTVGTILGLSSEIILEKLHQPWVQEGLYVPLQILESDEEALLDQLVEIPGVMIHEVERRYYPAGPDAAHLIGYLGEISAEELADNPGAGYVAGDIIGKAGLEGAFQSQLAGRKGCRLTILNGDGSERALVAEQEHEDGRDITLTIDLELQRYAAEALGEKRGAVLALDPAQGDILVLCSSPGFDPNRFIAGLSATEWRELQEGAQPFLNRALSGIYPPGSIFKPFTAAAAIDSRVLNPDKIIEIKGERWQPDRSWGDYFVRRVRPEVERLNLTEAMKYSDNIYFAMAGLALGENRFMEYGERFGFGDEIPFPLPVARSRLAREGIGSDVQLADSSYGQGEVMVTPLQIALLYSVFAGEGPMPKPRLFLTDEPAVWKEGLSDARVLRSIHRSLVEAVQGEGAPSAAGAIPGFQVAGKTGTAEADGSGGNTCWYVTYGPAESPEILVAVVIEEGSMASVEAIPVGQAVLERYLRSAGGR